MGGGGGIIYSPMNLTFSKKFSFFLIWNSFPFLPSFPLLSKPFLAQTKQQPLWNIVLLNFILFLTTYPKLFLGLGQTALYNIHTYMCIFFISCEYSLVAPAENTLQFMEIERGYFRRICTDNFRKLSPNGFNNF